MKVKIEIITDLTGDHVLTIPRQPVQDTITQSGYDWVEPVIKAKEDLIRSPGTRHVAIWHPNQSIWSDTAVTQISLMTTIIDGKTHKGRPATIEELATYEKDHHKEVGDTVVVALGERIPHGSRHYAATRGVNDSKRRLYLIPWDGDWSARYRFLVVFELLPS